MKMHMQIRKNIYTPQEGRLTGLLKIHDRALTRLLSPPGYMGEGEIRCGGKKKKN